MSGQTSIMAEQVLLSDHVTKIIFIPEPEAWNLLLHKNRKEYPFIE